MNRLRLSHPTGILRGKLRLPGSKSESNRLLILKELFAPDARIEGLSDSQDTHYLQKALKLYSSEEHLDIGDAGTAMRFLTAFLSTKEGEWVLSGSDRMHERPIGVLVEALRSLGASIQYLGEEGYPPLRIQGSTLEGGLLKIDAAVSSQFISALMMIAPTLKQGLEIKLEGSPVSMPYLQLTANLMRQMGFPVFILGDEIRVPAHQIDTLPRKLRVEPDWSAASYWFAMAVLAKEAEIYLPAFKQYSLQGDSIVQQYFAPLGVDQVFLGSGIRVHKAEPFPAPKQINLIHNPDLAQSLVPIYTALNQPMHFSGLQTLRIKETDRIGALAKELAKFGAIISSTEDTINTSSGFKAQSALIDTYGDHRMAMGLAPLALLAPIEINNPEVVSKSYPGFWEDCREMGFECVGCRT